jgi:putative beta-lysine N-acetyltransferase
MINKSICADGYEANIQLDPYNSRTRLLDYQGDAEKIIGAVKRICREHQFGKLICTIHPHDRRSFVDHGFLPEGTISGFFKGEDAECFSCFFDPGRAISNFLSTEDETISYCTDNDTQDDLPEISEGLRTAQKEDAEKIAVLFKEVFPFYPTPMNEPEYVKKMMDQDVLFKVLEKDGVLASVASADMNQEFLHAEITDCATRASFRGNGYLNQLVFSLENDLRTLGYITAFSLARAQSFGMNVVLSKRGYQYSGRHINNCRIMNGFEDMNIWVKRLQS